VKPESHLNASRFNGNHASGALAVATAIAVVGAVMPSVTSTFGLTQLTILAVMAVYALSQGFIWGFAGIMSFGQAAFFGLGGYAYAVSMSNLGDSTLPVLLAIVSPMLLAIVLGYFMFYGRINDAYIGAITLTVSVIMYQMINATSGSQYRIGQVSLGGFNGIPAVPTLNAIGHPGEPLDELGVWYVATGALLIVYLMLRAILATRLGRVMVAIRENETRAELIGYDPRFYKLLAFVIGAGVAGVAGCLYVNWAGFVSPSIFALTMSAQAIIFVLVGGLGTLVGPMLGAVAIQWLINNIGGQRMVDPNLGIGAILVLFVLLIPAGLVPVARRSLLRVMSHGAAGLFRPRGRPVSPVKEKRLE
jgi:branched-chain amino acid transport system permease protein